MNGNHLNPEYYFKPCFVLTKRYGIYLKELFSKPQMMSFLSFAASGKLIDLVNKDLALSFIQHPLAVLMSACGVSVHAVSHSVW